MLRAAAQSRIHPSALSRRLRDLEYALGEPIFERHPWA